ncbi:MAG: sulfotransferase, partial [Steroidobacteraceae bacterium]
MKPTFVIIGEQKAGTGWLRDRLREHPRVYCHDKEVNYFNDTRNYARGLAWYSKLLGTGSDAIAIGEKSPDYFWIDRPSDSHFPNPLENIARDLPQARIVLCLRDPVDRAISAFNHHLYHRGRRIDPRLTRAHSLGELLFSGQFGISEKWGILQRGFYAQRLGMARNLFGSGLLTLIFEEDIVRNPLAGLKRVCEHLGVEFLPGIFRLRDNPKERKPSYPEIVIGHHLQFLRPLLRSLRLGPPYRVSADKETRARLRSHY